MIGWRVAKVDWFGDRVMQAKDRAARRVLSRFGAFVRQRVRSSMKRSKAVSAPGDPPARHNDLLYDLMVFAADAESVVIGPVPLHKPGAAPVTLEYGGEGVATHQGRPFAAFYRPRPYLQPAFDVELEKMPPLWRDSLK